MTLVRCAWHPVYSGGRRRFLRVGSPRPWFRVVWSDGLCRTCAAALRAELDETPEAPASDRKPARLGA